MTQHVWTNDEIEKWWDDYYTKKGIPQCDRTFPLTVKMPPLIAVEPITIEAVALKKE